MKELTKEVVMTTPFSEDLPDELFATVEEIQRMQMMYNCVIREIKTKFEVLNDELNMKNQRNPIEFIETRVKTPASIFKKLKRKGFEISLDSAMENLNDIAGVRVICSFVDDIYAVTDMLTNQDDVKLIEVKDYIKEPKKNGYRSLHLIVEIPVFFSKHKEYLRAEVQVRTIAMDFWASLEHDLRYKRELPTAGPIISELKECAETIAETDLKMMGIRDRIETMEQENKIDKILFG